MFKNAATRFGIYIDAVGKNLSVEARGNNIRGFKKTPAYWDAEALELRLVEKTDHDEKVEERAERALAYLTTNPGPHSKTAIRKELGGRYEITDEALEVLKQRDRVYYLSGEPGTGSDAKGWIASIHAPLPLSLLDGTAPDSPSAVNGPVPPVPVPIGGQGWDGTGSDEAEEPTAEDVAYWEQRFREMESA